MEKKRPTYDLEAKDRLWVGGDAGNDIVGSARRNRGWASIERGRRNDRGIDRRMFHKSMTTFADHRVARRLP